MNAEVLLDSLTVNTWHPSGPGGNTLDNVICLSVEGWEEVKGVLDALNSLPEPLAEAVHWCKDCKKPVWPNCRMEDNGDPDPMNAYELMCLCPNCGDDTLPVSEYIAEYCTEETEQ